MFIISRDLIRKDVKIIISKMEGKHLVKIDLNSVSINEISYKEKDEISYKGNLYDIVKVENNNGKVCLVCYLDKKETILNTTFKNSNDENTGNGKSCNQKKNNLFVLVNIDSLPLESLCIKISLRTLIEYLSSYKGIFPSKIYNDILIPPPKLIA